MFFVHVQKTAIVEAVSETRTGASSVHRLVWSHIVFNRCLLAIVTVAFLGCTHWVERKMKNEDVEMPSNCQMKREIT